MLHNLKLGVLALCDDVIKVESTVGLEAGHILHHRVIGPDGICGNYVNVGQGARDADGLTPADEFLFGFLVELVLNGGHYDSSVFISSS